MSVAAPLVLRDGDRSRLEALTRSSSIRAGLATRARIVLLAADGLATEVPRGSKDAVAAGVWAAVVPRLPSPAGDSTAEPSGVEGNVRS